LFRKAKQEVTEEELTGCEGPCGLQTIWNLQPSMDDKQMWLVRLMTDAKTGDRQELPRPPWRLQHWRQLLAYHANTPNTPTLALLLLAELLFCLLIIWKVPYTEIDWRAYMEEVEGYLKGDTNYYNLKGGTGPLVYPAGFVYIYSLLYYVCDSGTNVQRGQYIFAVLYVINLALVFDLYSRSKKLPVWGFLLLCASRRVHSLFVLRLFNDPVAVLLFHASASLACRGKWRLSCLLFSMGVSVKMNILLYAPGLLFLLWRGMSERMRTSIKRDPVLPPLRICLRCVCVECSEWGECGRDCGLPVHMRWFPAVGGLPFPGHAPHRLHAPLIRTGEGIHVQVVGELAVCA